MCYDTPKSGTIEELAEFHKNARKKRLCYWLLETMPMYFRVKKMQFDDVIYWFKYRLQKKHKYHLIDTKLGPGYYENDKVMLYGMFAILVDYVEIELAYMNHCFKEEKNTKTNKQNGLEHLDWQINLVNEDKSSKHQSDTAQEIKDLYMWWTDSRPNRPDAMDVSGYNDIEQEYDSDLSVMEILAYRDEELKTKINTAFDKADIIDKQYEDQDTEMLIKLIKVRKTMWS